MEFYQYALQSSGILAAFYALYFLFLRNERFFVEIRAYLLLSLMLAVFLPFVRIPYTVLVEAVESSVSAELFAGTIIPENASEANARSLVNLPLLLLSFYLLVMFALLVRSLVKVWQIWSLIKGKEYLIQDNCKVILLDEKIPAFSFFGYVVIHKEEFENEELQNIFIHEKVHALQKHWIDLLLVEVISIVFWFNPFVWLFQIAIKQTHELLADDGVIARGFGIGQYQAILINQLMGAEVVGLANNFNHSINKKKMIMMSKEKGPNRRYKLLLIIPLVAVVLGLNMQVIEVQAQDVNGEKVKENTQDDKKVTPVVNIKGLVLAGDDKALPGAAITISNSTVGTISDINGNFTLPIVPLKADLTISFVGHETKRMSVEDFYLNGKEDKDGHYFLKIKLKTTQQKMLPAKSNDWTINKKDIKRSKQMHDGKPIFVIVEKMPQFPGGQALVQKYIAKSLVYPKEAVEKSITGRVFVTFIVSDEGKIEGERIVRGVHPLLDNEALRVIKSMPDWTPGEQRGKKVNVSFTLPITFSLGEEKVEKETETFEIQKKDGAIYMNGKKSYTMVDEMPEFPGGEKEMLKFIAQNVKYPKEAQKEGISGRVFVTFTVNEEGMIDSTRIVRGVSPSLDNEAMRVIKSMPKWTPGKEKGKPVSVVYTLPIKFSLGEKKKEELRSGKSDPVGKVIGEWNGDDVYLLVDEMPLFPGGHLKLKEHIEQEVKKLDASYKIDSRCFITFYLTKMGKVENVKVVRGTMNDKVDRKAVEIIENLPSWKPGKLDGKPAQVAYTVPVHFFK
ncbi:M56 family metallopeptidase [Marinifilum caeruleilacunae]|nr:M56 family metallopeptidase [Marinifilum caeruleilacunae]